MSDSYIYQTWTDDGRPIWRIVFDGREIKGTWNCSVPAKRYLAKLRAGRSRPTYVTHVPLTLIA